MSSRRGFLKQAFILAAGASVITPAVARAVKHLEVYHPEVTAVLERMTELEPYEKEAITQFVLAQIECGNWGKIDSFYQFDLSGENGLVNWMTGEKMELPEGVDVKY